MYWPLSQTFEEIRETYAVFVRKCSGIRQKSDNEMERIVKVGRKELRREGREDGSAHDGVL
jgi:hypothetical protein